MKNSSNNLEQLAINSIRMLAIDMIEKAKSGHPGMPLGVATIAYVLWSRFLRHNPNNPNWPDRDRFVLSAGHGSALLYALLYLTGYKISFSELKKFRQWKSKTPGHPEYNTIGVEATTGLLGQGLGMIIGMAIAERFLAAQFNRPGFNIVDHHIFAIVSDGDLMEGIAYEAVSLAGTLGLEKIICFYDDNKITVDGPTTLSFTENINLRFLACGWFVIGPINGDSIEDIDQAITQAIAETNRPTLIICRTHIGYGSPKQDNSLAHGEPLGSEAIEATRYFFSWPKKNFYIPKNAFKHFRKALVIGKKQENKWQKILAAYSKIYPELAATFASQITNKLPIKWEDVVPIFDTAVKLLATREASGIVLNSLASVLTNLIGGSADLASSTKAFIKGSGDLRGKGLTCGRNIYFGVREHAMGAAINGMALHGGVIPFGSTFFVFSDFMRSSLRLAALMQIRSIFIFTHDSLAVGEDGPTHQPVEQLMSLRLIPGFTCIRPADANETAEAWKILLARQGPSALILTRQKVPILDITKYPIKEGVAKGAYVLKDSDGPLQLIIIASGSEVALAIKAHEILDKQGIRVRVVSMPSWELFNEQLQNYRDQVLLPTIKARLAIEAGVSLGWERWVGESGIVIGLDHFGISAPGKIAMEQMGFNINNIVAKAISLLYKKNNFYDKIVKIKK